MRLRHTGLSGRRQDAVQHAGGTADPQAAIRRLGDGEPGKAPGLSGGNRFRAPRRGIL
jgi:hypothetical protein